ncbi:MAG: hypothetical protein LBE89_00570 [Helicobacteraceae bacterium]|jgi:hypothetical protein|nr:hypothetical protein [Helicobacteraceae bacterium]
MRKLVLLLAFAASLSAGVGVAVCTIAKTPPKASDMLKCEGDKEFKWQNLDGPTEYREIFYRGWRQVSVVYKASSDTYYYTFLLDY